MAGCWSSSQPCSNEKEQTGALGQKNIVTLVGVLKDFDSVSVLVVVVVVVVLNELKSANLPTLGKPLFPKRSLLASNSLFSWVSAVSRISSLLTFNRIVFIDYYARNI